MTDTRKAAQAVFDAFCASGSIHIDAIKQLGAPMKELGAALAQPEPTLDHVDLARRILTWSGRAISPSREPGADERVDSLAQALADWMPSQPEQQAPVSVNNTMVDAYLKANNAYWHRTDRLPQTPGKWRNGTPYEATRVSLIAALEAAHPPAQPIEPGNLYWRLHSLSKVLESSGRIDEHEQKGAYATILDAMNHVRSKP